MIVIKSPVVLVLSMRMVVVTMVREKCLTIRCRAHSTAYSLRPHVLSSDANPFISCAMDIGFSCVWCITGTPCLYITRPTLGDKLIQIL